MVDEDCGLYRYINADLDGMMGVRLDSIVGIIGTL